MGYRRSARERALQALFYMDMDKGKTELSEMVKYFCDIFPPPRRSQPFFRFIVEGVMHSRPKIDPIIERFSNNWKINRMPCVDRNIVRIAVFELIYCEDIPYKVSINEAIDIAKRYGTEESGPFINGILDSIRIALENHELEVDRTDNDIIYNPMGKE